jgi:hypothetical protein
MESTLIFSDVHADIGGLDMILATARSEEFARLYGPVRKIINLGDVLERGFQPAKVIRRLRGLDNLVSVLGNHDEAFLSRQEVSGSDSTSRRAHERFRKTPGYQQFFQGLGTYYVDEDLKLYAAHGGPIDPDKIPAKKKEIDIDMLYSRTWQRISEEDCSYDDFSGYHYMPLDAFNAVKETFDRPGFIIICGHQHEEAAYLQKGSVVEDILKTLEIRSVNINGLIFEEKKLPVKSKTNYLVRVGMAGPEGYRSCGFEESSFAVLSRNGRQRFLYLLNDKPERLLSV